MKNLLITFILSYFRFFAQQTLKKGKAKVIGITGSVGKSSARSAIYAVLKDYFSVQVIEKGNSEIGVPLGILGLSVHSLGFQTPLVSIFDYLRLLIAAPFSVGNLIDTQYLIIEMGVDEPNPPKNMDYLLSIVKPHISVFLTVQPVHTQQFETIVESTWLPEKKLDAILKKIAHEKGKIITESGCETGVYNGDNRYVEEVIEPFKQYKNNTKLFSFGSHNNDISYESYNTSLVGTEFRFLLANKSLVLVLKGYVLPEVYREVLASAILVGTQVGLTTQQIVQGLEKNFTIPAGRSSLLEGIRGSYIIDSSYNASKAATLAMLELLYYLKHQEKRPAVFLFGDMRELGAEAEVEHQAVLEKILEGVDYLYCVGPLTKKFIIESSKMKDERNKLKEIKWFENSVEAGNYLKDHLPENSIVLVKGSQNTIYLEEAIKYLLKNKEDEKKLCRQEEFWMQKNREL